MKLQEVRYILSANTDIDLTSQDLDGLFHDLHNSFVIDLFTFQSPKFKEALRK